MNISRVTILVYWILFGVGLLFLVGCFNDEIPGLSLVGNTDLSVTSNEEVIIWTDANDLINKINSIVNYDYGLAKPEEVDTMVVFNLDTTSITISINFKEEFQQKYFDPNISNNSITLLSQKESTILIDYNSIDPLSSGQYCDLLHALIYDLSDFNLDDQELTCIPLTFHIPEAINIPRDRIDATINNLNNNFRDSKISFTIDEVKKISNSFYNINFDETDNYPDVVNTLNIYVAHSLRQTCLKDVDGKLEETTCVLGGKAHFPTEFIDRVYMADLYFDSSKDEHSALLSHEIGHFLSLFHTFEINFDDHVCNDNGVISGDGIDDTPFDDSYNDKLAIFNYGIFCRALNLELREVIANFMSYALNSNPLKNCERQFTPEQHNRMAFSVLEWKRHLICENNDSEPDLGNSIISLTGNLNFGEVTLGESKTRTLTISNTGDESFEVTNIVLSNGFSVDWASGTIAGGSTKEVEVTFQPTSEQEYSGKLEVVSDAEEGEGEVSVSGIGVGTKTSVISLSGNLAFGQVTIGESKTRTLTISNQGDKSFDVTSINLPNGFSTDWSSGTIAGGNSKEVEITFEPTSEQEYSGRIEVASNAESGEGDILVSGIGINLVEDDSCSTLVDSRDGNEYNTVKIGDQCWMAENLSYDTPGNDDFPYNGDSDNLQTYGRLYDWNTIMNGANASESNPSGVQGICPNGWHIPSKEEFDVLIGNYFNNTAAQEALLEGGISGFNALLAGTNGQITTQKEGEALGMEGKLWSTTIGPSVWIGEDYYYTLSIYPIDSQNSLSTNEASLSTTTWSCRCIKD